MRGIETHVYGERADEDMLQNDGTITQMPVSGRVLLHVLLMLELRRCSIYH